MQDVTKRMGSLTSPKFDKVQKFDNWKRLRNERNWPCPA
ncbi:unnamed protein product, partial [Larinioides sclopetarius]